jgi:hypothetical protein
METPLNRRRLAVAMVCERDGERECARVVDRELAHVERAERHVASDAVDADVEPRMARICKFRSFDHGVCTQVERCDGVSIRIGFAAIAIS